MKISAFSGWETDILAGHSMVNAYFEVKSFLLFIKQFLKTEISYCLKSFQLMHNRWIKD